MTSNLTNNPERTMRKTPITQAVEDWDAEISDAREYNLLSLRSLREPEKSDH
jgi:hypothetical protein